MARIVVGLAAGVLLLVAAGCGEDAQQQRAREALQAHLRTLPGDGGYRVESAHCASSPRVGYVNVVTISRFVCAAQNVSGGCDWFRVTLRRQEAARIVLLRRDAGCVLPVG